VDGWGERERGWAKGGGRKGSKTRASSTSSHDRERTARTSTCTNGWVQTRMSDGAQACISEGEHERPRTSPNEANTTEGWEGWEGQLVPRGLMRAGEDEHEG
jgi:hypothetical protein